MKSIIAFVLLIAAAVHCQDDFGLGDELNGLGPPKPIIGPRSSGGTANKLGYLYFYTDRPVTWFAAEHFCSQFNQRLVKIDDWRISFDIHHNLQMSGLDNRSFWTSGNNLDDRREWHWGLDGDPLNKYSFSDWNSNATTDDPTMRCLSIQKFTMKWEMSNCNNEQFIICQDKPKCL